MNLIVMVWLLLGLVFFGVPSLYLLYLRRVASKPWNLNIDRKYDPPITIIIPTHNEEKTIGFKLENLCKVEYPKEKMQIILIDDASTDNTIKEVFKFLNLHPELNVELLNETERRGKSAVLNLALKRAKHDIIVMSDADAFWNSKILIETLPYLADPLVGAVIGRQKILNSNQSWITKIEETYLNLTFEIIRLGESKIHSTIIFHGLFG
ncbi:MAG: glycosyltransferase, partial [Candidatus Heimdallarchaeota archaeon]